MVRLALLAHHQPLRTVFKAYTAGGSKRHGSALCQAGTRRAAGSLPAAPDHHHHQQQQQEGQSRPLPTEAMAAAPRQGTASSAALAVSAAAALLAPQPAQALSLQTAVEGIEGWVTQAGALGPLVFIVAYVLATVLLVPGSLLTVAAGALFGPVKGTLVVSLASTAGASAAFLVGRYLARPAVERRLASNPKFEAVDGAIGAQGAKIVLLLRLSPLFPFTLLNYALSLTRIKFGPYVLASWAGMLPGTIAFVALGGAGRAAAESASGGGVGPLQLGLYGVGAIATLWATSLISKAASRALQEASAVGDGSGDSDSASTPLNK